MKKRISDGFRGLGRLLKRIPIARIWQALSARENRLKVILGVCLFFFFFFALGWYWSREPGLRDAREVALRWVGGDQSLLVTGTFTTAMVIEVADTLLTKPGGYLTNDITPPSVFLDNMPSWEYGVLTQLRDMTRSLRNDMSRSRSQSREVDALAVAEPAFNYSNDSFVFTQSKYRQGRRAMKTYLEGITRNNDPNTQFYARADNLRDYLAVVEKRLGSLSQRLGASVGQVRANTDLAGERGASQSTRTDRSQVVKTSWWDIDNVFYETRGSAWALIHFMRAIENDFADVLADKNATALVRQIIIELEGTQRTVWSPMILNGSGFGLWANHSLVIASYISRANAAVIDLRELLLQG